MGYQCFHCGHNEVFWQNDFMFEDYGIEGNGIVHVLTCGNCGAEIEYYVRIEEEENGQREDPGNSNGLTAPEDNSR